MSTFINYIPYIVPCLLFLVNVFNLVYTRHTGKSIDKELKDMFYRTADYRENPDEIDSGTKFSNLIPRFRLNKASGVLEPDEPLDITKLVNSSRNVELKSLLQALEAGNAELVQQVKTQYNDYSDTLDELANALDVAEDYRVRFGLGDDVSVSDIFARIEAERDKLKESLDNIEKSKAQPQAQPVNTDKETDNNASQNVEKTE